MSGVLTALVAQSLGCWSNCPRSWSDTNALDYIGLDACEQAARNQGVTFFSLEDGGHCWLHTEEQVVAQAPVPENWDCNAAGEHCLTHVYELIEQGSQTTTVTVTGDTYVDGPRVANSVYMTHCTSTVFSSQVEAQASCNLDSRCSVLHDYACLGMAWHYCTSSIEVIMKASVQETLSCTKVVDEVLAAMTHTQTSTTTFMTPTFTSSQTVTHTSATATATSISTRTHTSKTTQSTTTVSITASLTSITEMTSLTRTSGSLTSTSRSTTTVTSTTDYYVDGPRVSNSVYLEHCNSEHSGDVSGAAAMCNQDPSCSVLHDYSCLGLAWHWCSVSIVDMQAASTSSEACTKIAASYLAGLTHTETSTTTAATLTDTSISTFTETDTETQVTSTSRTSGSTTTSTTTSSTSSSQTTSTTIRITSTVTTSSTSTTATTTNTIQQLPYNCNAGLSNWEVGWSSSKKAFCCEHFGICVTTTTRSTATMSVTSVTKTSATVTSASATVTSVTTSATNTSISTSTQSTTTNATTTFSTGTETSATTTRTSATSVSTSTTLGPTFTTLSYTSSTVSETAPFTVRGSMTVDNVNFADLDSNAPLKAIFTDSCEQAVADAAGDAITTSMVTVTLSSGSVDVSYVIAVPATLEPSATADTLAAAATGGSLARNLVSTLSTIPGISDVTTGTIGVSNVAVPVVGFVDGSTSDEDEDTVSDFSATVVYVIAAVSAGLCVAVVVATVASRTTMGKQLRQRSASEPGVDSEKGIDGLSTYVCGPCGVVCCPQGHSLENLGTTCDDGWFCDGSQEEGGCKSGFSGEHQTFGVERFRCEQCDYDLCPKCIRAKLMPFIAEEDCAPPVRVRPTDGSPCSLPGRFTAPVEDKASEHSHSESTPRSVKPVNMPDGLRPKRVTCKVCCWQGHPLIGLGTLMDDGWSCDGKMEEGGCRSGYSKDYETDGKDRFRCEACDYDLCPKCFEAKVQALWANPEGMSPDTFEPGTCVAGYVAEVIAPSEGLLLVDIGATSLGVLKTLPRIAKIHRHGDEIPQMIVNHVAGLVDDGDHRIEPCVQLSLEWSAWELPDDPIEMSAPQHQSSVEQPRPYSLYSIFSNAQGGNADENENENEDPSNGRQTFGLESIFPAISSFAPLAAFTSQASRSADVDHADSGDGASAAGASSGWVPRWKEIIL